jgi:hypothetical protein
MTAPANSLRRIRSAKNRVPHLTGWGTSGSRRTEKETQKNEATLVRWAHDLLLEFIEIAQYIVPTLVVIACNLFR